MLAHPGRLAGHFIAAGGKQREAGIADQYTEEADADQRVQRHHRRHADPQGGGEKRGEEGASLPRAAGHDRKDQGGDGEDKEDVGDAGADDVADGKARTAREGRVHRDEDFRQRGAEGDDEDAGDEGGGAHRPAGADRAAHEQVSPEGQKDEAADKRSNQDGIGHGTCPFETSRCV